MASTTREQLSKSELILNLSNDVVWRHIIPRLPWHTRPLATAISKEWESCFEETDELNTITTLKQMPPQGIVVAYCPWGASPKHKTVKILNIGCRTFPRHDPTHKNMNDGLKNSAILQIYDGQQWRLLPVIREPIGEIGTINAGERSVSVTGDAFTYYNRLNLGRCKWKWEKIFCNRSFNQNLCGRQRLNRHLRMSNAPPTSIGRQNELPIRMTGKKNEAFILLVDNTGPRLFNTNNMQYIDIASPVDKFSFANTRSIPFNARGPRQYALNNLSPLLTDYRSTRSAIMRAQMWEWREEAIPEMLEGFNGFYPIHVDGHESAIAFRNNRTDFGGWRNPLMWIDRKNNVVDYHIVGLDSQCLVDGKQPTAVGFVEGSAEVDADGTQRTYVYAVEIDEVNEWEIWRGALEGNTLQWKKISSPTFPATYHRPVICALSKY